MERIGGMLRAIRQQRKLSLREIEERSRIVAQERGDESYRISASWLGRLEKEQHALTANRLIVLAHIYGLPPEQLLRSIYPDSLDRDAPPNASCLLSPGHDQLQGTYGLAIIGKQDHTLAPMIPGGSLVQIDTRRRVVPPRREWAHEFQRPIYFLKATNAYFCGWCELDPLGKLLTLVPHPLSPDSHRSWKYPEEVEIIGRVVGVQRTLEDTD